MEQNILPSAGDIVITNRIFFPYDISPDIGLPWISCTSMENVDEAVCPKCVSS